MLVIVKFISLLISGVSSAFSFILMIPSLIATSLLIIPSSLSSVLITCFGILVAIRVLELLP